MKNAPRRGTGSGAGDGKVGGGCDLESSLSASRFQQFPTSADNWRPLGGIIIDVIDGLADAQLGRAGR